MVDVAFLDVGVEGRARPGEHVAVAGGVDHHLGHQRLTAGLALEHRAGDLALLHDRQGRPAVEHQANARFQQHLLGKDLQPLGVQGGRPADHAMEGGGALAPVGGLRWLARAPVSRLRPRQRLGRQAVQHLLGEAPDDLAALPVRHPVDPDDETTGGKAAQVIVALEQHHVRAGPGGRQRRSAAGGPAAHHQDVAPVIDRDVAAGFAVDARPVLRRQRPRVRLEHVRRQKSVFGLDDLLNARALGLIGHGGLSGGAGVFTQLGRGLQSPIDRTLCFLMGLELNRAVGPADRDSGCRRLLMLCNNVRASGERDQGELCARRAPEAAAPTGLTPVPQVSP